jgi:kumamolisin
MPAEAGGKVGRGVPDVSGNADPTSGYKVVVDGQAVVIGGTSAAAALWAGLIALLNQGLGPNLGHVNPLLYRVAGQGVFHAITSGQNGLDSVKGFPAGPGWNAATGWGTPDGGKLLEALRGTAR